MKENFEIIKAEVNINDVATRLLGEPIKGMYKHPGERTASLKIYPETRSFYDFGRGVGGDVIRLWSHVKGCDNWEAMNEIAAIFGVSAVLNETDRKSTTERIRQQEKAQEKRRQAERREQKQWVMQVDRLHEELELYDNLLNSPHIPPLSWVWTWCMNGKQLAEYELDCLCGILD